MIRVAHENEHGTKIAGDRVHWTSHNSLRRRRQAGPGRAIRAWV